MTWSGRRQSIIITGITIVVVGLLALFLYPKFHKAPTCFDNKQNGDEAGVDCGGSSCRAFCPFEVTDASVKWTRSFPVTDIVYNAVAYVENPNVTGGVYSIPYIFQFYDQGNKLISERQGETYIAPNGRTAIFEQAVKVNADRAPKYTTFKFLAPFSWIKVDDRVKDIKIVSKNESLASVDTKPRFQATVTNTSTLYGITNLDVVIVLYDAADNAVGVSKTFLERLGPGESMPVYYTWQRPFETPVVRYEIIPRFNPFTLTF